MIDVQKTIRRLPADAFNVREPAREKSGETQQRIDADGAAAVKRFYDEIGIRALAIYVDSASRATGSLGIVGIPTTLLVDRQGREVGRRAGAAQWDGPDALRMIAAYLEPGAKP